MPENQPLQHSVFSHEDAIEEVDKLLEKTLVEASAARIRLAILSQKSNQLELQYFLREAVNAVGMHLNKESLNRFVNEACEAFLDKKL